MDSVWSNELLVQALLDNQLVVMPTDTVYGIVGKALNPDVVQRIYSARKRSPEKPCIVLIGGVTELERFGIEISAGQGDIINQYWPGPVSIIVDCPCAQFEYLHRGTNSLAFRLPASHPLRTLLNRTGPIIAPSANTEGSAVATTIADAQLYFGGSVDLYIDGGTIVGSPSKILKLHNDGSVAVIRG